MLAGFLLSLREGLESALVIGVVLGILHKLNRRELRLPVWAGVAAASILSLGIALILNYLGAEFEGRAEQIFEGTAMLAAVGLLTWMLFWMRSQAGLARQKLEADIQTAISNGGAGRLFSLAFLGVGRDGLELAIFLTASAFASSKSQTFSGAFLGLAVAVLLGFGLFASTVRLNLKSFFLITNLILILFAAGMAARSVREYNEAGLVPPAVQHIWNLNPVLNEESPAGQVLGTLFGYSASPSLTEFSAYCGYLALLGLLFWRMRPRPPVVSPIP